MKKPYRQADGLYHVDGKTYKTLFGSREQVYNGTVYKTTGGLTKSDIIMNKWGRIVSANKFKTAKKEMRLQKHGFFAKKGKFGAVTRKRGIKMGGADIDTADAATAAATVANAPVANAPVANAPVTNAAVANAPVANAPVIDNTANAATANATAANATTTAANATTANATTANGQTGGTKKSKKTRNPERYDLVIDGETTKMTGKKSSSNKKKSSSNRK
jgi:hypothetical protein